MARSLAELVRVRRQFARSANVENDSVQDIVEDYLITARALDVMGRIVDGLNEVSAGRAISITGPYGSGKSSLALLLSGLLGPAGAGRTTAERLLASADSTLASRFVGSRAEVCEASGFLIAAAVAQREPVATTILRALKAGAVRYSGSEATTREVPALRALLDLPDTGSALAVVSVLRGVAQIVPVLIVLDEFGKNLEEFVASGSIEADVFVLQNIAELANSATVRPILLLTLQHLSFEEYSAEASTAKRRELSKVHGRFVDVPYVDPSWQSQFLIAGVFEHVGDLASWGSAMAAIAEMAGVADQLRVPAERLLPLHPLAALVLPELCSRYGQHERTLFSFLTGGDPLAVPAFLRETTLRGEQAPACVGLDRVYDYFVESAPTMLAASSSPSRWLEIETRIRDVAGLTESELRLAKTVAVLNLVATGGVLRASAITLVAALTGLGHRVSGREEVETALSRLEALGVLTYRAFADEYRIWNGSDFDVRGAVELARRRLANEPAAAILERVCPQSPIVAARHSQRTGTFRVFERRFVGGDQPSELDSVSTTYDGVVLLCLSEDWAPRGIQGSAHQAPTLVGFNRGSVHHLIACASELAAHIAAVEEAPEGMVDWVGRRELRERAAVARSTLDGVVEATFGAAAEGLEWFALEPDGRTLRPLQEPSLAVALSRLCDDRYPKAPIVRNEMLARRDLTSQGARARRDLVEAMVTHPHEPRCGIEGYGPERAMYEAILARPGIHSFRDGKWGFGAPFRSTEGRDALGYEPVWTALEKILKDSERSQIGLGALYAQLAAPPFGLKAGPLPVLAVAAVLSKIDNVALYEQGSFVARIDTPIVERLLRNPELFTFKKYATGGTRAMVPARVGAALGIDSPGGPEVRVASVVAAVGALLAKVRALPPYAKKTGRLSAAAIAVRSVLLAATEPDELLFAGLPQAVGLPPFSVATVSEGEQVDLFCVRLVDALTELSGALDHLLNDIEVQVRDGLAIHGVDIRVQLSIRLSAFSDRIIDPRVNAFIFALQDTHLDRSGWLERVGMAVVSKPPRMWGDDDIREFELRLTGLADAVRRIESLHHYEQLRRPAEGFEAVRVGLTRPDGTDGSRVVWMDNDVPREFVQLIADSLAAAERMLGQAGREMLLAGLALEVLAVEKQVPGRSAQEGTAVG